jgi:hypothetical protein
MMPKNQKNQVQNTGVENAITDRLQAVGEHGAFGEYRPA